MLHQVLDATLIAKKWRPLDTSSIRDEPSHLFIIARYPRVCTTEPKTAGAAPELTEVTSGWAQAHRHIDYTIPQAGSMPESFEMLNYLDHLRLRWRVIAVACGSAVVLAIIATLLTPAQYTATARVMIEPPAGSDPRGAIAVSPIYLESLKSYELLASGDRLFQDTLDHFKLPRTKSLDSLKRSVLKVSICPTANLFNSLATTR